MARIFASSCVLMLVSLTWATSASWSGGEVDQKEYGIDLLNTSAAMESWVVCGFSEGFKWPDERKTGTFRIGVLDNPELLKFLMNSCHMQPSGSQIVEISSCPPTPNDSFYHILCVGDVNSPAWGAWKGVLEDDPTVVVTRADGGIPDQALVNFHYVDGELKLQLDTKLAERLQISIGNELKSWVE